MALEPGSELGRYQIVSLIGSGGMGQVYTAIDPKLRRTVALKVLPESLSANSEFRERFLREARAVASLAHPNIVQIYDIGDEAGVLWIAMQLVSGGDLRDRILAGPLALDGAQRFLRQVAAALDAAHQRGIVHRDVKPDNVLLSNDGSSALLTDFGIAKGFERNSELTQTGAFIGTPKYSAPEAIIGGSVDHRVDIYSLGVVAYEMLTGRPPFAGSATEVIAAHLRDAPASPRTLRPDLSRKLAAAVLRALAKTPDARFASAGEFIEAAFDDQPAVAAGPRGPAGGSGVLAWFLNLFRKGEGQKNAPAVKLRGGEGTRAVPPRPTRLPDPAPRVEPEFDDHTVIQPAPRTIVLKRAQEEAVRAAARPEPDATQYVARPDAGLALPVALMILRSPDPQQVGRRVLVTTPSFLVGRSKDANLCLAADPMVSRDHVEILTDDGGYRIRAIGRNGTYVNGRLVGTDLAQPLFLNDWIMLSSATVLSFVADVPKMPDLTGKLLDGRFVLQRLLHESIKSATYAGSDRELPRELAVKVLSPVLARSAAYREEFRRQARAAAGLRHAHICRVVHFDEGRIDDDEADETYQYLCMDLLVGGTLRSRLEREPLPALERVTAWLGAVGGAVQYAHENGVVHGGIKPGCVIFDESETPHLGDFAVASMRGDTSYSPVVGAPAFLAPEQWEGKAPTPASDQYALGAVAYRLITGSIPFEGQDQPEVRKRNLRRGPVPAHEEALAMNRGGVCEEVSDVLAKALHVEPADRYASVADFVDALTGALGPSGGGDPEREPIVFVSYQRTSSTALALFLARELRDRGIRAAVDTEIRDRAIQFPEKLRNEISRCDVFVCLLGEDTLASEWVRNEIRIANEHARPMIPIFQEGFSTKRAEPVDPEISVLLEYDGVHVLDRQGLFVDAAVEKLAKLVHGTVDRRPHENG